MQTCWLIALGVLLAGYFALEGADFGAGMLLAAYGRADRRGRELVIRSIAPLFLGNEVWLVAAVGTMLATLPVLDGALESRLSPLLVPILLAWLARDAGLWFRRHGGPAWRAGWERVIAVASAVLAAGWGMVLGNFAAGVPSVGSARVFGPVPLLFGLLLLGWCLLHGAAFLGRRLPEPEVLRLRRLVVRLALPVAGVVVATATVLAVAGGPASTGWAGFVLAGLLLVGALLAGVDRGRTATLVVTSVGLLALVPLLVAAGWPALPGGLTLATASAGPATLAALTPIVLPVLPVLVGAQALLWWLCRGRVSTRVGSYF
jgi:cytochrome bd ubiquinol oxidase subunit II